MRSRTTSGVRLDYYQRLIYKTILKHVDPVTGLIPSTIGQNHAWVRDNVYSILAIWGLSMAYRKNADFDEDHAKTYELEQACVKCMRGILRSMMLQKEKLEKFKSTLHPHDALHAKYNSTTGQTVVGDKDWGHLQIDATSLFLLILAQMTASGIQIVFNMDEVSFVQNLIFYIESAYCIPDYGIWERGDKTNHGLPELNASSIGLAKAALEAMNELDLFGARGGPYSTIHVLADEAQKCQAVLQSILPRESNSKEVDAALLSVIGFPAFAVDDIELINTTRKTILDKLLGKYGCKRFLRDGYKTAKEDSNRLYYEPWELRAFENIENEWPLFLCYLMIDYWFYGDRESVSDIYNCLESLTIKTDDGLKLVPEMYMVPKEVIAEEKKKPHSQVREAIGKAPFLWAQSLYLLGCLMKEGYLAAGELDPLNRRLGSEKKPDVVVQVVILAENEDIQSKLKSYDVFVQTVAEVAPIEVQPARVLSHLYTYLGKNSKLGLTGRQSKDVGILSTSKLYSLQEKLFAFTPQSFDHQSSYMASDSDFTIYRFEAGLAYLTSAWRCQGRPTVVVVLYQKYWEENGEVSPAMISTLKKLKSGYTSGTRVALGNLSDFLSTSCITDLSFLDNHEDGFPDSLKPEACQYLEHQLQKTFFSKDHLKATKLSGRKKSDQRMRKKSIKGCVKRSRSIVVDRALVESVVPVVNVVSGSISSMSSPDQDEDDEQWKPILRQRTSSSSYEKIEDEDLLLSLRDTENLEEQGDILHYLVTVHGLQFETGTLFQGHPITIKDLLKELYEKACHAKHWALVRHTAGILGKRVEDLPKAVTDLLVRQKQVTVGMPPDFEQTITAPLPANELRNLIHGAYGDDESSAMLTQELLVYLAMFIRTEPQLFGEVLRLRVGLIIKVMAYELTRVLDCSGEEGSEHLLNLSPFEMKNLLHHIMSGKEFCLGSARGGALLVVSNKSSKVSNKSHIELPKFSDHDSLYDVKQGQWLRRRRLDGALNRVPRNFYENIWSLLERCQGLAIEGRALSQSLTQEMTPGELKFALQVETLLNTIPQPEYRQLIVEALMVLTTLSEHDIVSDFHQVINVEQIVHLANIIFLEDQKLVKGDALLCCLKEPPEICKTAGHICSHFYDSAPSGSYGTMSYLIRAATSTLDCLPKEGEIDCTIN